MNYKRWDYPEVVFRKMGFILEVRILLSDQHHKYPCFDYCSDYWVESHSNLLKCNMRLRPLAEILRIISEERGPNFER